MNIGLDLRLVNTRTLEVVDVISYQKQIVAHQIGVGVFTFWNGNAVERRRRRRGHRAAAAGVRSVIERATVEMVANLYGMPGPEACMHFDPLGETVTTGVTGAYIPAYDNLKSNNAATRADPYRWDGGRSDPPPATVSDRDDRGHYSDDGRDRY